MGSHSGVHLAHGQHRTRQGASGLNQPFQKFPAALLLPDGLNQDVGVNEVGSGDLVAAAGLNALEPRLGLGSHLANPIVRIPAHLRMVFVLPDRLPILEHLQEPLPLDFALGQVNQERTAPTCSNDLVDLSDYSGGNWTSVRCLGIGPASIATRMTTTRATIP